MPNKTGIEALKEIKAMDPGAKVVMCSAMGQEAMVVEAIKLLSLIHISYFRAEIPHRLTRTKKRKKSRSMTSVLRRSSLRNR